MWDLTGRTISGMYLGTFPVKGTVVNSRVTYGGWVTHNVDLDEPVTVYGDVRTGVILRMFEVTAVHPDKSNS